MHRLTSALLLGGAVLLVSYINAPAAPTPAPPSVSPDEVAAIDAAVALSDEVAQEAERLRARLAVVPDEPLAKRDPFSFGPAVRPARRVETPATEIVESGVQEPPPIAWPRLVALLTDAGGTAATTAVLAVGDAVEMLKVGETAGGFTIRAIATGSIEIMHAATSRLTRLSLR